MATVLPDHNVTGSRVEEWLRYMAEVGELPEGDPQSIIELYLKWMAENGLSKFTDEEEAKLKAAIASNGIGYTLGDLDITWDGVIDPEAATLGIDFGYGGDFMYTKIDSRFPFINGLRDIIGKNASVSNQMFGELTGEIEELHYGHDILFFATDSIINSEYEQIAGICLAINLVALGGSLPIMYAFPLAGTYHQYVFDVDITVPEPGIYFIYSAAGMNMTSIVSIGSGSGGQSVGTIDAKYIPALATKADLVEGMVPSSQLPSYVDDVLEFVTYAAFPVTGETGKIYVAKDTNLTYRWTGSVYVRINEVDLSNYYTKTQTDGYLATKQDVISVTSADNDKVMKVVNGEWAKADAPDPLPPVSSSDNGKVLGVDNGAWTPVSGQQAQGINVSSADNGKVLGIVNGAWDKMDIPNPLPAVSASDNGKVLGVVNGQWGLISYPSANGQSF